MAWWAVFWTTWKSSSLAISCHSAIRSLPDLWQDNLTCEKETMIPIFFPKSFETYGYESISLNIIAHPLAVLKPRFPGHRGTLIELSFVIQGKCKPLFCLSCSLALPVHSVIASGVELALRDSTLKSSFLILYSAGRFRDVSCLQLHKLQAWQDNQVKEDCQCVVFFKALNVRKGRQFK